MHESTSHAIDVGAALDTNRRHWDELAPRHSDTELYAAKWSRLRAGGSTIRRIEREEVGDVHGTTLLHLQCHIGTESIGWALLGAKVTAVDFSPPALEVARQHAAEFGAEVRFLQSDVLQLDSVLREQFDVVYTSWGVLGWIPNLYRWGEVVSAMLKPGGFVYVAEFHPVLWLFDEQADEPRLKYDYFGAEPFRDESDGSYADRGMRTEHRVTYTWYYTIGDTASALCAAGLRLEFLHELPRTPYQSLPCLQRDDAEDGEGWWRMPDGTPSLPLAFTLRARREH